MNQLVTAGESVLESYEPTLLGAAASEESSEFGESALLCC